MPAVLTLNPVAAAIFVWPVAPFVGIATFVPAYLVAKHCRRRRITSLAYFAGWALAIGVVYGLLCSMIVSGHPPPMSPMDPTRLSFRAACGRYLPAFIIGGLAGGATYWHIAGRHPARSQY